MQTLHFRLGSCPGKSSQQWAGRGTESLSEVLVPHSAQVAAEQPSGALPLSAVAAFWHERSTAEVLGHKLSCSPKRGCSTDSGGSSRSSEPTCEWGEECLLNCGFLFSSTPLAWQWACDPFTSVAMKTTVSWPSPESYCRRKLFVPVYSLTKGSQTQSDPPFFFFSYHLPCFVKKVGPKHAWDNCKEWHERSARGGAASACLCVHVWVSVGCVCVTHKHTHTQTPGHCQIGSRDILCRIQK